MKTALKSMSAAILAAVVLTGCSTSVFTPIGDNNYDCNRRENPNSPYCHSFTAVEKGTNRPLPDSRYDGTVSMEDSYRLNGISADGTPLQASDGHGVMIPVLHDTTIARPHNPTDASKPVRELPVVQRVKIYKWVDDQDNLHEESVVFREVRSSTWSGYAPIETEQDRQIMGAAYPHSEEDDSSADTPQKLTPAKAPAEQQPASQPAAQDSDFSQPSGTDVPPPPAEQSSGMPQ